ncbi:HlyD family type I secretion periplasmic adaptor subunit [Sphingomonas sanguinis]|jgi:HlyD family type I secretion membrane fusion protein|uniref:Membrane fusion protein (MFP) family protein n=1 Tax=Sphingomonas sanguinis TaxID=33051 RepID=A0A7Y7QVU9_9SPHN|nr:HlyD family type I secretion periplasmic adaptor subunit [Sphingomonas sanguinis]MBZ6382333.1 HlyD family type I secretion periplasmic adaptor subunit [Sphingomonas sanguinis]NNG50919.1 HlyD family type I secretion periplasmic adaptor subunit [Sphingomonas sanguinis]NNG54293.1 HlyD family type I secretion periplasmic adaptor subunit [Sphingomonas sanguinis]NVP31631.1 HlyD family type I secretion periplasmic adaptor subunit [Sphingomonas sanguinis]
MNHTPPLPSPDAAATDLADPRRDIRLGLIVAALFFIGFLGWTLFVRLDAAAYAPGTLVVSGQRQAVQHRDGGMVGQIFVHEGERVRRGQLLMTLAAAEVRAQERALASQAIRLLAQRSRLEAEQMGRATITEPREFASLAPEDRDEARLAMRLQRTELAARTAVLAAQRGALGERVAQSGEQGRGLGEQAAAAREQLRLINEQIAALRPIANRGFVSQTRMRELERARAELEGQRGQYTAGVAQTAGAVRENRIQVLEAERVFRERTAADLRDVESRLGEVMPRWVAARDQLARTAIRAPATGAVVGLTIFTPGGVIAPGQKLMDIVPERQPLRIQARIAPDDADDLHVGQRTLVKFPGLHERTLPNLDGTLSRLSADSFTDEKTGQTYFTGEVTVPLDQIALIRKVRGRDFALRAGMPVQVLIPLRKRTALDYALEPLVGSFWSSFREH